MGPFYDLVVRRSQLPSPDMWKAACQKDKRCNFFFIDFYVYMYILFFIWFIVIKILLVIEIIILCIHTHNILYIL